MKTVTDFTIYPNSYAWRMRNVLLDRLKLVPPFNSSEMKAFRRVPSQEPVQDEHIPLLGVYLLPDEEMNGIGKNNQGDPIFSTEVLLGFSYVIFNNNTDEIEQKLDVGYWSIMKLLHVPQWHEWPEAEQYLPDGTKKNAMIEAVTKVSRRNNWGNTQKGSPIAEMQMEWTISYQTIFEAAPTDDFESVNFKAIYPWPEDENRRPIVAEWTVPTSLTKVVGYQEK